MTKITIFIFLLVIPFTHLFASLYDPTDVEEVSAEVCLLTAEEDQNNSDHLLVSLHCKNSTLFSRILAVKDAILVFNRLESSLSEGKITLNRKLLDQSLRPTLRVLNDTAFIEKLKELAY